MAIKIALDTSAIVAMVLRERDYERLTTVSEMANSLAVGAPTLLEAGMVLSSRLNTDARPIVWELVRRLRAEVVDFDAVHMDAAVGAFLRFGKGRHPAALNIGDCLSYAVAYVAEIPLLYIGNDFSKTDIESA